ncbi:MAG: glycosyltransferase [Anaerolineales bacterium]|nr:glycosyltransferase [Anaerolineales bacterium]
MNSPRPLVSVIIPVLNGERFLAEAVSSVLEQNYRPVEILVIDGRSIDGTAEIARSFEKVRYICQTDQGLANARNEGIRAAGGELIAFLDHDDIWTLNKLGIQVDYLIQHSNIQYTISKIRLFLEQGCVLPLGYSKRLIENSQVGFTPGALVARKSLFQKIGFFNSEYAIGCDTDWFARTLDANVPMVVIPQILHYKRIHDANLSLIVRVYKEELLSLLNKSIKRKRGRIKNQLTWE